MTASAAARPLRTLTGGVRGILRTGGRGGADAGRTARKAGAGEAAKLGAPLDDEREQETSSTRAGGFETLLFTQLERPRLVERAASDLSIDQARRLATDAQQFYNYQFPLFPSGDFFYEEVEEAFIARALGRDSDAIDQFFLEVMTRFRRVLNDNTRRMLMVFTPLFFGLGVVGAWLLHNTGLVGRLLAEYMALAPMEMTPPAAAMGAMETALAMGFGGLAAFVVTWIAFYWPYKVVQERNMLNLDNYITSKFARINHNFQVAKRHALNVERDKRMMEREALKDEAGAWTVAYHWFAMRLFLCELTIRNRFYQLRRNTTLYVLGAGVLSILGLLAVLLAAYFAGVPVETLAVGGGVALFFLLCTLGVVRNASSLLFREVEGQEWGRFHDIELNNAIAFHAAEDKVQIVTFRDRNRME